jgi:hypothetical protein
VEDGAWDVAMTAMGYEWRFILFLIGLDWIGNLLTTVMFSLSKNGQFGPSLLSYPENSSVTTRLSHLSISGKAVNV